jgi:tRNA threonylcarbamoyladenosine biosynthesis protein TsaB
MITLAIETATGFCSVALNDGKKLYFKQNSAPSMQSENLFSMIIEILDEAQLKISDLDTIITSNGPGSFTGIRIGVSAVRGMKIALDKVKIIGLSSLVTLAYCASKKTNIIAAINAGRGDLYIQKFSPDMKEISAISVINENQLDHEAIGYELVANNPSNKNLQINASTIIKLVEEHPFLLNNPPPFPLYIKPADAKKPSAKN